MIIDQDLAQASPTLQAVRALFRADETAVVRSLLEEARLSEEQRKRIAGQARRLVERVRAAQSGQGGIEAFLHEFELSSQEGVVLMCLAEALLRVPDAPTIDRLIRDKIATADWQAHLGHSDSLFVNASTWALMLTGHVVRLEGSERRDFGQVLRRLVQRSGEPVIRTAMTQAMRILGRQFVMGRDIEEALERARSMERRGYRYSYDMLGEAARTAADAERYFAAYREAIAAIGEAGRGKSVADSPGISVKLSALHPRYEFAQRGRVLAELAPRLLALARDAKTADIGLNVDAEESDRLEISLEVIETVSAAPEIAGWDGFGVVVQAYQKRATAVIDWLSDMARRHRRKLMVRLVKGAYWDSEIKRSQERGLKGYPVFTRKASTDVSYIACAKRLLAEAEVFYPQFATHNAQTLATVLELAGDRRDYEFQRLHGMGEALYEEVVGAEKLDIPCRIYAPVGSHEDLLAYLVRRLLENGANTSFVNRIVDEEVDIEEIIADPVEQVSKLKSLPHPRIPLPADIYGPERRNSSGVDLFEPREMASLGADMQAALAKGWRAQPLVGGTALDGPAQQLRDPADRRRLVGEVVWADKAAVDRALTIAEAAAPRWAATPVAERARAIEKAADLLEGHRANLMAICVREAGKTIPDAVAELREAVDFCRYYALRAREEFGTSIELPSLNGQARRALRRGVGVFTCISPWNFPLAIFTGQIMAALAAGNAVVAKPAEQTPLIAAYAARLFHEAGIPPEVLQLLPGDGPGVGGPLVADRRVNGVAFTGSTEVAQLINRTLAARGGDIPLIAETGGQNAMIVDSTALPEQVVADALISAFQSAGQRCSALRVLFVQDDVAERMINMLAGAMDELVIGDPMTLATDVGPVIDEEARDLLTGHIKRMDREARLIHRAQIGEDCAHGTFLAPVAYEIDSLNILQREVFGPVLHVVRYRADRIDKVVEAINATGYGLTLGIHSRIDHSVFDLFEQLRVGNTYVNRNQIGAVVGVQPFGGQGLSGTGPKAGGPHYLPRFSSVTAEGGSAAAAIDSAPAPKGGPLKAVQRTGPEALGRALVLARRTALAWAERPAAVRAEIIDSAAQILRAEFQEIVGALVEQTGKDDPSAAEELELAIAEMTAYANVGREAFAGPLVLPGPTGERNELSLHPRGVFACLGSSRLALAGLAGQVTAALVAGNAVIAKPGERAPGVARFLLNAFRGAGLDEGILQFVQGDGASLGGMLVADSRIDGVAFQGALETAGRIAEIIAERDGPIIPFVVRPVAPLDLYRFTHERVLTIDTTAAGGNASLMSLEELPV